MEPCLQALLLILEESPKERLAVAHEVASQADLLGFLVGMNHPGFPGGSKR